MLRLDHIAVLGETLEEAVAHTEAGLGLPMLPGGRHPHYATHNRLFGLADGLYIEAIATDPAATPPDYPRWFGLDTFQGPPKLDKWVCRVDDMAAALSALPMAGRPVPLSRGDLRWVMSVPENGLLPFDGLFPALIEWQTPVPPGNTISTPSHRLDRLEVSHARAEEMRALLVPHLDVPQVVFSTADTPALTARIGSAQGMVVLR